MSAIYDVASSAAPRVRTAPAAGARRIGVRRIWRRVAVAVLGVGVACAAIVEASLATGPSVDAVPTAVAAIDTTHAAAPVMVSPSDHIAEAIVAVEDASFYTNDGVDTPALVRASLGFVTGSDSGGSTIEVQLAHLAFPAPTSGLWGRVHRVTLAVQMDTHFTKRAILSMYLDAAYFGHGFYGIAAASHGYFGVAPSQLSWSQAALLAGLVQAPSALDPIDHPAAALARRGYALERLADVGALSQARADSLSRTPLGVRPA